MRFIICGDALFSSRNLCNRLDPRLVQLLADADAVFANAEFCTPRYATPPAAGRGYMTSVRPDTLDEFNDLNIRLLSFANNHTGDYGWQGIVDTLEETERRGLIHCGIGRDLSDARKARFFDTPIARIGIVSTASTRSEAFAASNAQNGIPARPGLNPLRWSISYMLENEQFEALKHIDELLGTRASAAESTRVETWKDLGPNEFKFGSMFEGNLHIIRSDRNQVVTAANPQDEAEILKDVRDARRRSDIPMVTIHTHEGIDNNWYSPQPAEFIREFAHESIDAGAELFVGHGAHFMRGIEVYKGHPIFYNLGSILMEFEAGESLIAPEMYEFYGYDNTARPSDLHSNRAKDKDGNFIGFNAERRFSKNIAVILDYEQGQIRYRLLPLDLHLNDDKPLHRGLPTIATPNVGREIADDLCRISNDLVAFEYDKSSGLISFRVKH